LSDDELEAVASIANTYSLDSYMNPPEVANMFRCIFKEFFNEDQVKPAQYILGGKSETFMSTLENSLAQIGEWYRAHNLP